MDQATSAQQIQAQASPGQPGQVPTGQPIMYQMPHGQPQPVFAQPSVGQPTMTPQGQPIQYYVPAGQPVQQVQPAPQQVKPDQPQHQDGAGANIHINTSYLRSKVFGSKMIDIVILIIAWVIIDQYTKRTYWGTGEASFYRGVIIFSWVVDILIQVVFIFDIHKMVFTRSSHSALITMFIHIPLLALMIACSAKLAILAKELKIFTEKSYFKRSPLDPHELAPMFLLSATVLGFFICLIFLEDINLFYKMYKREKTQERGGDQQNAQQPGTAGLVTQPAPTSPAAFNAQL